MNVYEILNRIYVNDMDQAVAFYERLLGETCKKRLEHKQLQLELAQIGNLLLIGGSEEVLTPFRNTKATFLVDSIVEFKIFLLENGATIIRDLMETPTGITMIVKHFDGTVVEYMEQRN